MAGIALSSPILFYSLSSPILFYLDKNEVNPCGSIKTGVKKRKTCSEHVITKSKRALPKKITMINGKTVYVCMYTYMCTSDFYVYQYTFINALNCTDCTYLYWALKYTSKMLKWECASHKIM